VHFEPVLQQRTHNMAADESARASNQHSVHAITRQNERP
jgi:hypothetical protein